MVLDTFLCVPKAWNSLNRQAEPQFEQSIYAMEAIDDEKKYTKTGEGELSGSESPENDGIIWGEEEETKLVRK